MLSFANITTTTALNQKSLWQVGNSWGTVTKYYAPNGTVDSEYDVNYTIQNVSLWNNEKVFILHEMSNATITDQFYNYQNYSLVGANSELLFGTSNETTNTTYSSYTNPINHITEPGTFNYTTTEHYIVYNNLTGPSSSGVLYTIKEKGIYSSTSLVKISSEKKTVKAGTFNCWKIESQPLYTIVNSTDYQSNGQNANYISNTTFIYFSNNTAKEITTLGTYNSTTKTVSPIFPPSSYMNATSQFIYTQWISKALNLEIANEYESTTMELVYLLIDGKSYTSLQPQPLNLILPLTITSLGVLAIGTVYIVVELVAYRKTPKNRQYSNSTSFLSYLKQKTFKHEKKKERETLSEKTLHKMEEIIKENEV